MVTVNNFFDEVFVLNLNRSYDRWKKTRIRLRRENIFYKRITGIDKVMPSLKTEFQKHKKRTTTKIRTIGRYAVWRSFSKMFEHILDYNYKKILIFEDDVTFHKKFDYLFDLTINKYLPKTWDMWYLGATQVNWRNIKVENEFPLYHPTGNTFGMFAVAFNVDFIRKNYKYYKRGGQNNDHFWSQMKNYDNIYVSYPRLCGHDTGFSINAGYEITDSIADRLVYFKYDKNIYY